MIGIKSRGTVFTTGGSLVKQFIPKLQLGLEVTGARTKDSQLGKAHLQTVLGGNYQVKSNWSFDFAVLAGKYAASPRTGIQLGISVDFEAVSTCKTTRGYGGYGASVFSSFANRAIMFS